MIMSNDEEAYSSSFFAGGLNLQKAHAPPLPSPLLNKSVLDMTTISSPITNHQGDVKNVFTYEHDNFV